MQLMILRVLLSALFAAACLGVQWYVIIPMALMFMTSGNAPPEQQAAGGSTGAAGARGGARPAATAQ